MLAPSIPHHRGRDNEIRGNSRKDSFVRKLSKSSTTPLPALSLSFFSPAIFCPLALAPSYQNLTKSLTEIVKTGTPNQNHP